LVIENTFLKRFLFFEHFCKFTRRLSKCLVTSLLKPF
jgi:hypothetical protein